MTRRFALIAALVAAPLLALAARAAFVRHESALAEAQGIAASAIKTADRELERAKRAEHAADSISTLERQARSRESRAVARADSATRRELIARERYRIAAQAAPDTCQPIVAAADSALATSDSVAAALRDALTIAQERATLLEAAVDTLRPANVRLQAALADLRSATTLVILRQHPSLLSRLLHVVPKPGFGVSGGIDTGGTPRIVTGLTFGWTF